MYWGLVLLLCMLFDMCMLVCCVEVIDVVCVVCGVIDVVSVIDVLFGELEI